MTSPSPDSPSPAASAGEQRLRAEIGACCHAVRCYLLAMTGNWHEADEAAAEALAKAWQKRHLFDGRSQVRTWIFTIARNHWRDEIRKRKRRPKRQDMQDIPETALAVEADPAQGLDRAGLTEAIARAMASLPEEQREAIALREGQALTFREIGELLDVPLATVKSRVRYGLEKLAQILAPYRKELLP
jgi:RNA polymerase sigma-70 factor (ECF subfamily)